MDSRGFFIRNFRNIGVCKDNKEQGAFLRLSGLEKDVLGGLVIILGENNTGKSNLLDALAKFGSFFVDSEFKNELSQDDIPNFNGYRHCLPKIELNYRSSTQYIHYDFETYKNRTFKTPEEFKKHLEELQNKLDNYEVYIEPIKQDNEIKLILKDRNSNDGHLIHCEPDMLKCVREHTQIEPQVNKSTLLPYRFVITDNVKKANSTELLIDFLKSNKQKFRNRGVAISLNKDGKIQQENFLDNKTLKDDTADDSNYNQKVPRIIFYKEYPISGKDLEIEPNSINDSRFFKMLFKRIGYKTEDIQKDYQSNDRTAYLDTENWINDKLQAISQQFNSLYNKNKNGKQIKEIYGFKIRLEKNQIILMISKNNHLLVLDKQSIGFRKFFNFYFNYIYVDGIKKGDIMLIDEVENSLSIPVQREFRKFLKDFGQQFGILFIISTHSPFMIDMDYLDDIRILKEKNKEGEVGIEIINDFSFIPSEQTNTLLELKEALGVDYCHILNPTSKPIFVEGITDYNYLIAFKLLYEHEQNKELNLTFLPIQGLGNKNEYNNVLVSLIDFGEKLKANPIVLLVDNDKAGIRVKSSINGDKSKNKQQNSKNLKVVTLNEVPLLNNKIGDGNITIEYLFSEKDRNHLKIERENKGSQESSVFKNRIKINIEHDKAINLDEETKKNFYALLEYLHEVVYLDKQEKEDNTKT